MRKLFGTVCFYVTLVIALHLHASFDVEVNVNAEVKITFINKSKKRDLGNASIAVSREYFFSEMYSIDEVKNDYKENDSIYSFAATLNQGPHYLVVKVDSSSLFSKKDPAHFLKQFYLFYPGTDLTITIDKDEKIAFNGDKNQLFQCQYEIYKVGNDIKGKVITDKYMYYQHVLTARDSLFDIKTAILNKYKNNIGREAFDILLLNLEANKYSGILGSLKANYIYGDSAKQRSIQKFYADNYEKLTIDFRRYSAIAIKASIEVANYLKLKSFCDFGLLKNEPSFKFKLPELFSYIETKYSGNLRDKLLTEVLLHYNGKDDSLSLYWNDVVGVINNDEYKSLLEKNNANLIGSVLKPFEFELISGDLLTNRDLHSKVTIFDFWFTGCTPCAGLQDAMDSLEKAGAIPKEVEIISVCVDSIKDMWKKSYETEKYSSKKHKNVFTNGLGYKHPFLKGYGIFGFPRLIAVDDSGKILSLNLSQPSIASTKASQRFLDQIDSWLK